MDEEKLKMLFAELIEATGAAIGLVTSALAKQIDAQKLATELRAQLQAAKATGLMPGLAVRLATHALAAADAETAMRNPPKH